MPEEKISEQQFTEGQKNFPKYNYDVVMEEMRPVGRYHFLLIIMAFYTPIPTGMNQVASVFLSALPEHRCSVPELEIGNFTDGEIRRMSIPLDSEQKYDGCKRFNYQEDCPANNLSECFLNTTSTCTDGYVYDQSLYISTIVTEWDLVCDRLIFGSVSTLIYFFGVLLSAPIGGNLSDRFGRTRVSLFASIMVFVAGIACSYAPSLAIFSLTRFVIACALNTQWQAMFVYLVEIVPNEWRTPIGIMLHGIFAVGYMLLTGLSYIWRDWRSLQFAMSFWAIVFPALWIFLPESPRWLLSKGQVEKGMKCTMEIAERNGRPLSDGVWDRALIKDEDGGSEKQHFPHELFRRPLMRRVTIEMMFVWFSISLVYYGLSLNVGNLVGGNRVNNILGGISEILSCPLAILTIDRFGRKPVLCALMLASGALCIIAAIAQYFSPSILALGIAGTVFALVGKLTISAAFGIIYNYTAELYPTVVRATAIGTGSMSARVGSMLSPLIILIQHSVPWLTGTVMGLLSIFAGVVCLFLPETKSHSLTTTLDEAETFYAQARNLSKAKAKQGGAEESNAML